MDTTSFAARPRLRGLAAALALASALVACGDDGGDGPAPMLLSRFPLADAGIQDRDVEPQLTYDVPLDIFSGAVVATADGAPIAGLSLSFSLDAFVVSVRPPAGGWPAGRLVRLEFSELRGASGGEAEPVTLEFRTLDDEPPTYEFTPANGATVANVRDITAIVVTFSEPMNPALGTITAVSPTFAFFETALEERVWSEGNTVLTLPRRGDGVIPYNTEYRFNFANFADVTGNGAMERAYRFTTGPDSQAPRVVEATPMEGAVDVNPQLTEIVVRFDEALRESANARLESAGALVATVRGDLDAAGRTVTFDLSDAGGSSLLLENAAHKLFLTGFRDQANNPPSADPMLGGDAALDFTTGPDVFSPEVRAFVGDFLIFGIPTEVDLIDGPNNVDFDALRELRVSFTEAMDTTVPTQFVLSDGVTDQVIPHEWRLGGALLVLDPTAVEFQTTSTYTIDLSMLRDERGNAIVAGPLGDAPVLTFTTRTPSGESCDEPFTVRDGTRTGTETAWTLTADRLTVADGGTRSCDPDGATGPDVVIAYEKTTPSVAEDPVAGRLLRVRAGVGMMGLYNLEIVSGDCDPGAAGAVILHCAAERAVWFRELDVPAGTYYVKVASADDAEFPAGELRIDEVAVGREGESCLNPFDTTSPIYLPPSGSDGARWDIPADGALGLDRRARAGTVLDCAGDPMGSGFDGVDAVIEFRKASAASFLEVEVASDGARVGIYRTCDAAGEPFYCGDPADAHTFRGGAFLPAGPVYVWISLDAPGAEFPLTNVEITERALDAGEGCQAANAITAAGAVSLGTLDSDEALDRPSCFPGTADVEWFAYTPTDDAVAFAPNAASAIAVLDRGTGEVLACEERLNGFAIGKLVDGSETLCIAVPVDTAATSLTVIDEPYDGVGDTRTSVGITLPTGVTIQQDNYLVRRGSTLYLGYFQDSAGLPSEILQVPTAGGTATRRAASDGVSRTTVLRGAAFAGNALFSVNGETSATGNRLYRLFDGTSWGATVWDGTSVSYPATQFWGIASDGTDVFFVTRKTVPGSTATDTTFYRRSAASAGAPTSLGTNVEIYLVQSLAVDDTYFYLTGLLANGDRSGVYRIPRANPAQSPTRLSPPIAFRRNEPTSLVLDDPLDPSYLYVRAVDPEGVHVIAEPDSAAPIYLGVVSDIESTSDGAMAYDPADDALFVFEQAPTPRFVKLR